MTNIYFIATIDIENIGSFSLFSFLFFLKRFSKYFKWDVTEKKDIY